MVGAGPCWQRELLAAWLVILLLGVGCGPAQEVNPTHVNDIVLTANHTGSQIQLAPGQTLLVSLESNPTTGYGWAVEGDIEPTLRQVGAAQFEPQSNLVGAPGVETLRFEGWQAGETTLELVYRRSWEKGIEPLQRFSVQVTVR